MKKHEDLRIIETARDEQSINAAIHKGFKPLVKQVKPSPKIKAKYTVVRNKKTVQIEVLTDYRSGMGSGLELEDYETLIDWSFYYPYHFKSPFAAYLLPADIEVGEKVWIKDLIEDYVGSSWNQGDCFRLESSMATWNGVDLLIDYDEKKDKQVLIG